MPPTIGQSSDAGGARQQLAPIQPFDTAGYCASRFWLDFGQWGVAPGVPRIAKTYNFGFNSYEWHDVTGTAGFVVCPQGSVSATGGRLTVAFSDGQLFVFEVASNHYRWVTASAARDCGWDFFCSGTQCSPVPFGMAGRYDSDCYINQGLSCGDDYSYITFATSSGTYCAPPPTKSSGGSINTGG
jgi:hypothetical protein